MNFLKKYILIILMVSLVCSGWIVRFFCMEPKPVIRGKVSAVEKPKKNLKGLLTGEYQSTLEKFINQNIPFQSYFIKVHNEVLFDIFQKSPVNSVVLGKNNVLYEPLYLKEYTGKEPYNPKDIETKVEDLLYIQKKLESLGKMCYVIITPSKADFYPEEIPDSYIKNSSLSQSNSVRAYEVLLQEFDKKGIHYFDGNAYAKNIQLQTGKGTVFSRTGIHWNYAAASEVASELFRTINTTYDENIPYFTVEEYERVLYNNTFYDDFDIYHLMNTIEKISIQKYKNDTYYKPKLKYDIPFPSSKIYSIFTQGGSFQEELYFGLSSNPGIPIYYTNVGNRIVKNHRERYTVDNFEIFDFEKYINNDLFLFEVNVSRASDISFGFIENFKKYLENLTSLPDTAPEYLDVTNQIFPNKMYGIYSDKGNYIWTYKNFGIDIVNHNISKKGLQIDLKYDNSFLYPTLGKNQFIDVYINGTCVIEQQQIDNSTNKITIPVEKIPRNENGHYIIEIKCAISFVPAHYSNLGNDSRELGILINYIGDIKS